MWECWNLSGRILRDFKRITWLLSWNVRPSCAVFKASCRFVPSAAFVWGSFVTLRRGEKRLVNWTRENSVSGGSRPNTYSLRLYHESIALECTVPPKSRRNPVERFKTSVWWCNLTPIFDTHKLWWILHHLLVVIVSVKLAWSIVSGDIIPANTCILHVFNKAEKANDMKGKTMPLLKKLDN